MRNNPILVVQNAVQNPGVQDVGNQNGLIVVPGIPNRNRNGNVVAVRVEGNANGNNGNQIRCYNCRGLGHLARNYTVRPRRRDATYLQTKLLNPNKIAQNEEAGIQLQAEEFDFMAVAADLDEIEEVNANCILMANLQQASTSEEEYTELLEPIPEPHQVQQNNSNVIFKEEKKKLKSDFKIHEDDLLDKQIQLKNKLKELDNILVKTGQSIQTMHMLLPKPDSFYQTEQKMALGYQNLFYLKQTQQKQQSLYNGKVLLEKHDPPAVYNSEETLELAQEKAAKFVQDFKSLAKEADESIAKHKALELEIDHLLRAVVSQDIMSIVQNNSVVDTSNLQTELKRMKECLKIISLKRRMTYNDMQQNIEQLQAQLGDIKGKSKDTLCVSDTLDPLPQKHENENVELEFQVLNYEKENAHLKTTYKNVFDSINVTRAQTKTVSEPKDTTKVTSNSAPSSRESNVVNNEKVIAPGIFRINPFKASRVTNFVPNKHVKASVRTKPITVSQPHVITKEDVNSNTCGFSPKDIDSTTKTRRPQSRNNPKNARVPSKSKSSCLSNKLEKIKENHRSLQPSNYPDHTSSEYNNIKLAIRNGKFEVICATCKQCLITANHDECVLQYVNGMKSRKKNQRANVSKSANQKKHKANVKKSKKSGSKESLASPSKPRSFLRWSPTGRIFDLCGKITSSSNTEIESDTSVYDNASASNPQEPTNKRFPSSTSFLDRFTRLLRQNTCIHPLVVL
ncbi:hypothetical protein Tco_0536240 [Tanacetum coccineum]